MNTKLLSGVATVLVLAGCASTPPVEEVDRAMEEMMKSSFRDQGIAKVDRLNQDLAQQACSSEDGVEGIIRRTRGAVDEAKQIEKQELASIKWPSDGRFLGDFKAGEKLAQSGRGLTWSDKSTDPKSNGGSCYNCHQISKEEVSYGTVGPSLYNYGKLRGVDDPASPASKAVVEYTWGKLWNSKAYAACSNMPRFGHMKILDENQLRDLMALLLDPKSPVNQ